MSGHRVLNDLLNADFDLPDPGDGGVIRPTQNFQVCHLKSAAAEARTLPDPVKAGLRLTLVMHTDGGDITLTAASDFGTSGQDVATFGDEGDVIELVSVTLATAGLVWRVVGNVGVTLS